jgi:hypothetical protein
MGGDVKTASQHKRDAADGRVEQALGVGRKSARKREVASFCLEFFCLLFCFKTKK